MGRSNCNFLNPVFTPTVVWITVWSLCALSWVGIAALARGDDGYVKNAGRLAEMTPEQKEELGRNKLQFDQLSPAEKQRLRDLHAAIAGDEKAQELNDTATRYSRWLANLDSAERSTLLDIKDPQQRIARIKELMQQQEERRFRTYAGNLPEEDRKTIYKWLGEWVAAHAHEIREHLPRDMKERIDDAPDDESRRRALIESWQRSRRHVAPVAVDYAELFKRFSSETQKYIEASAASALTGETEQNRTPQRLHELQDRKLEELVRTALYSRIFPLVSQEELLKFYAAMKPDDPRRKQLEGKEGDDLRRELYRIYNWEHGMGRGGPPGGRGFGSGSPPWSGPSGGRGDSRGFRPEDRDRPPLPPNDRPPPPPK